MTTKKRWQRLAGILTETENVSSNLRESVPEEHGFNQYLNQKNNKLSQDEFIGHRNYLKVAAPVIKKIEQLQGSYFNNRRRFTAEEEELLNDALRVLRRSLVPLALIEKEEEEPIVLLGDM